MRAPFVYGLFSSLYLLATWVTNYHGVGFTYQCHGPLKGCDITELALESFKYNCQLPTPAQDSGPILPSGQILGCLGRCMWFLAGSGLGFFNRAWWHFDNLQITMFWSHVWVYLEALRLPPANPSLGPLTRRQFEQWQQMLYVSFKDNVARQGKMFIAL